jgi:hypothetical protein
MAKSERARPQIEAPANPLGGAIRLAAIQGSVMKHEIISVVIGALALVAASSASARVGVSINLGPLFGYGGYPPPVIYQPEPVYAPPPLVYGGAGAWGGDRRRAPEIRHGGARRAGDDHSRGSGHAAPARKR